MLFCGQLVKMFGRMVCACCWVLFAHRIVEPSKKSVRRASSVIDDMRVLWEIAAPWGRKKHEMLSNTEMSVKKSTAQLGPNGVWGRINTLLWLIKLFVDWRDVESWAVFWKAKINGKEVRNVVGWVDDLMWCKMFRYYAWCTRMCLVNFICDQNWFQDLWRRIVHWDKDLCSFLWKWEHFATKSHFCH